MKTKLANQTAYGNPTKDFFITMLTKDITLKDAIGDLVDNSIDAIKVKDLSIRNGLNKYQIEIVVNESKFSIKDNGSGIEEETARTRAFMQGKPQDKALINDSIGRFGIGMKRAFFKLGNIIKVVSVAPTSRFTLTIKVKEWKQDPDNWNFTFDSVATGENNPPSLTGTHIIISDLSEDAKGSFSDSIFENELIDEIGREQVLNIQKGIKIKINTTKIQPEPISLKYDRELRPSFWKKSFNHGKNNLDVEILAGVSTEKQDEGGWNIFCNDRLIVDRDTTKLTGWTGSGTGGMAKYHQQYYGFRGYVFFRSKDASLLPWNTTKTGIDPDSLDYLSVKKKMIESTKEVFQLLNRLKKEREKNNPEKSQILNLKIKSAKSKLVVELLDMKSKLDESFHFPPDLSTPPKEPGEKIIKYSVPTAKFNKVKKNIDADNPADVGMKTFDYYYENEVEG